MDLLGDTGALRLLRDTGALRLLRLDDPHRHVVVIGWVIAFDQAAVPLAQEEPRPLQRLLRELELGQRGLMGTELAAQGLDLATQGSQRASASGNGLCRAGRRVVIERRIDDP